MKTRILLITLSIICVVMGTKAQSVDEFPDDYVFGGLNGNPEVLAKFPGNVYDWLSKNIRYPEQAVKDSIEGRVSVQFIVEKDGSIG